MMHLIQFERSLNMSQNTIAVALDINKIPYVNDHEIILTPGIQKVWYTAKTVPIIIPKRIKLMDSLINSFLDKFSKNNNKRNILKLNYFAKKVSKYLNRVEHDQVIFENDQLKSLVLSNLKNKNKYITNKEKALSIEG